MFGREGLGHHGKKRLLDEQEVRCVASLRARAEVQGPAMTSGKMYERWRSRRFRVLMRVHDDVTIWWNVWAVTPGIDQNMDLKLEYWKLGPLIPVRMGYNCQVQPAIISAHCCRVYT